MILTFKIKLLTIFLKIKISEKKQFNLYSSTLKRSKISNNLKIKL